MAKKDIHPAYNELSVVLTDGTEFKTKSCCKDKVIKLDIDPLNHPAWKSDNSRFVNLKDDQVTKFNKRFGNFKFGLGKESAKKVEAKKEEVKEVKEVKKVEEVKKVKKVEEVKKVENKKEDKK